MEITINKKEWFENVIYDIVVVNPSDDFLKLAENFITEDHAKQSFMPRIVKCEHLVTKYDSSNSFNPSKFVVSKNNEFINDIREMFEVSE